ncbi:GrpB family protein [Neobacillus sp. SCS-31]|uniref:GrpB family protein n=1 Tax=Neobacillus oceani TaxID=3115292 RepID=UPI003905C530
MLGLPRGEVFLVPWTQEWKEEFLKEKVQIEEKIGAYIVAVHHIGSTAVPHLSAKPILDIAIELEHFGDGLHCVSPLEALGYRYRGTNVLPERHYFNKGEPRTHQIHMYEKGNKYLLEQLEFRDYLRNNEDARIEYENLKFRLSGKNKHDKHQYADDKTGFVRSALCKIFK